MRYNIALATVFLCGILCGCSCHGKQIGDADQKAEDDGRLIPDPSFEKIKERDKFGNVFSKWRAWIWEGDAEIRASHIAHSGSRSCLIVASGQPKIRVFVEHEDLAPGRYMITAYVRGLNIGVGKWEQTTELAFNGKYIRLQKNGTFGWTKLTYVAEVKQKDKVNGPSFGLMAPGRLWIDDVHMTQVGDETPLTAEPVWGEEEEPISKDSETLGSTFIRCPECNYKNVPGAKRCRVCGVDFVPRAPRSSGPAVKILDSFETSSFFGGFSGGSTVKQHATHGHKSLKISEGYVVWDKKQDWSGYDYLLVDTYNESDKPITLFVEVRDAKTTGYWTRVNYNAVVLPGASTIQLYLDQLYVGEKSRPGRKFMQHAVTRLVFSIGEEPVGSVFIDNVRLERDPWQDPDPDDGIQAFDFGTSDSPIMPSFTKIDNSTIYNAGKGYGLKKAQIWRSYDVLQPDPLYQDFVCIERGGLAIDVPNGTYHVFVNIDNPSGYWGEYQIYRDRAVLAEGKVMVRDTMDYDSFSNKYLRFWDTEDSYAEDTFNKYQTAYYDEKEFDVEVKDGQLNIEFQCLDWGCSVSAVVVYPTKNRAQGRKFLNAVKEKRKHFFDSYFKRVGHIAGGDPVSPSQMDKQRGYLLFSRDYMSDVFSNDKPYRAEIGATVTGFGFAGEKEPLTASLHAIKDLGKVRVTVSDLVGPGTIPASDIAVGYVSNRITRETMDGATYSIRPRFVMPKSDIEIKKGTTRRFWLTVHVPSRVQHGIYRGEISFEPENGAAHALPIEFRVYKGTLDALDIPVGPWGHTINMPWFEGDKKTKSWNAEMARKSLRILRDNGFTTFSGMPVLRYKGFDKGNPVIDFEQADRQMEMARSAGFNMPLVSYTRVSGLDLYFKDEDAMRRAGFSDYSRFVKAVFTTVQKHAVEKNWLPVYWNIGDEPRGKKLQRATENAVEYRKAFPQGPPFFTAATSFESGDRTDSRYRFVKALHLANLNRHNEQSIRLLGKTGTSWANYNGGNRWTYGIYMYKAAKEFGMKLRLNWHWNISAGDPYYALDCREDDYSWAAAMPDRNLMTSVEFERHMREGIDDYRYMLTLARLAKEKGDTQSKDIIEDRLDMFEIDQNGRESLPAPREWREFRIKMAQSIERLRK